MNGRICKVPNEIVGMGNNDENIINDNRKFLIDFACFINFRIMYTYCTHKFNTQSNVIY